MAKGQAEGAGMWVRWVAGAANEGGAGRVPGRDLRGTKRAASSSSSANRAARLVRLQLEC